MDISVADDFRTAIAHRLRTDHAILAARWLERLSNLLPVDAREVFPSDTLLDHIPDLIVEIGDYVLAPEREAIAANTAILLKARDLGALRFSQRATVHQIMREYRILDSIVLSFMEELAKGWGPVVSAQVIAVSADLHQAVSVLQEATVASFIACYADEAKEQADRLSAFNRMVSHELRQPMGTLQFALRLLEAQDAGADGIERGRLLALLGRNVNRAVEMTERLARMSGLADEDTVQMQKASLTSVAREAARQLRAMAEAREVTIDVDAELPTTVVDVAALELALLNLLSNAIKYSDPAKPVRAVRVQNGRPVDGCCVLDVIDNGLGIPASHLGDVFERSVRAHATRDAELGVDGLGLGLVIVRDCVRRLKGRISVRSVEGEGTTFTLQFPLR
jgi:signal transduction histidine kinase